MNPWKWEFFSSNSRTGITATLDLIKIPCNFILNSQIIQFIICEDPIVHFQDKGLKCKVILILIKNLYIKSVNLKALMY